MKGGQLLMDMVAYVSSGKGSHLHTPSVIQNDLGILMLSDGDIRLDPWSGL